MTKPHKHAELIKKWADDPSIELEFKNSDSYEWNTLLGSPTWMTHREYRIKPKLVKREGWMLVSKRSLPVARLTSNVYQTKQEADEVRPKHGEYLTIKVEWEEEEV